VESLQNKYLAQVNAIRRGIGSGEEAGRAADRAPDDELSRERVALQARVGLMERELLRTAEELGAARAETAAAQAQAKIVRETTAAAALATGSLPALATTLSAAAPEDHFSSQERVALVGEVRSLRSQLQDATLRLQESQQAAVANGERKIVSNRSTHSASTGEERAAGAGCQEENRRVVELEESVALLTQQLRESREEQSRLVALGREVQWRHQSELAEKEGALQAAQAEIRLQGERARQPLTPQMQSFAVSKWVVGSQSHMDIYRI
jgi:hypothetical protein